MGVYLVKLDEKPFQIFANPDDAQMYGRKLQERGYGDFEIEYIK